MSRESRPLRMVLASASLRRRDLLEAIGVEVVVRTPACREIHRPGEPPEAFVQRLAVEKSESVGANDPESTTNELILAADTVVVLDGEPIGKPRDDGEALLILRALSGRAHEVVTGYLLRKGARRESGVVTTVVRFRPLENSEIRAYIASGEGRDKAGAYGIQGKGGALVEHIDGSYTNVVGLPIAEVLGAARKLTD